jgi:hypothetical protein
MVVLQIEIANVVAVDDEGDPPVARDRDAPAWRSVTDELVNSPAGRPCHLRHAPGSDQRRQDVAHAPHEIWTYLPLVVALEQPPKAAMPNRPNPQRAICTLSAYEHQ